MLTALFTIHCSLFISHIVAQTYQTYPQQMERLDRGVIALPAQDEGIFVSWRLLGTDPQGTTFDLLRDGKTIAKGLRDNKSPLANYLKGKK